MEQHFVVKEQKQTQTQICSLCSLLINLMSNFQLDLVHCQTEDNLEQWRSQEFSLGGEMLKAKLI